MHVRRATDRDVAPIREVAKRSWTTDYPDIVTRETAEEAVDDWYAPERLAAELRDSRTLVLVADDGGLRGFVHATWNVTDREGYILRLYVDPDHRREGVGRTLLDRTTTELVDAGVDRINAMVLSANEPGRQFYEGFGFEHADERQTTVGGRSYPESRYVFDRDGD
ncbi:GNAT family N-acetyltransferase [Halomarina oriensis]|uniref:GNAT family N-acetyltransferase n=1 Tax=Halomarina oriensis TaxID=671145 RepID=A0A6B0GI20_9EURY|nr:GNAT family N-acetyltransferase [Halomarina oriensis]MWG34516.1 GNAT family N-acetyltransferase [Halomarina oriensis]